MTDDPSEPQPVVVDLPEMQAREALTRLRNARGQIEMWEREEKAAKADLIAMIGDGDEARLGGVKAFTYKLKNGGHLDTTKLKENLPDVYGAYYRPTQHREFRLSS